MVYRFGPRETPSAAAVADVGVAVGESFVGVVDVVGE